MATENEGGFLLFSNIRMLLQGNLSGNGGSGRENFTQK